MLIFASRPIQPRLDPLAFQILQMYIVISWERHKRRLMRRSDFGPSLKSFPPFLVPLSRPSPILRLKISECDVTAWLCANILAISIVSLLAIRPIVSWLKRQVDYKTTRRMRWTGSMSNSRSSSTFSLDFFPLLFLFQPLPRHEATKEQ